MSAPASLPHAGSGWTPRRRRWFCLAMLAVTLPLGLVWRLAPLHLPQFAFKYGGSALWAVAVYWVAAAVLPRANPARLGVVAALIALLVELAKLIFWPPLDRFRETLAGKLLLGRYFTFGAIVAYWLAITVIALLDSKWCSHAAQTATHGPNPHGRNTVA